MAEAELVNDLWPVELRHPERVRARSGVIGRGAHPIAHLAHRATRALQRPCNLPQSPPLSEPPFNLFVPVHREYPPRHAALPFVMVTTVAGRTADRGGGPCFGSSSRKIDRLQRRRRRDRRLPLILGTRKTPFTFAHRLSAPALRRCAHAPPSRS